MMYFAACGLINENPPTEHVNDQESTENQAAVDKMIKDWRFCLKTLTQVSYAYIHIVYRYILSDWCMKLINAYKHV